jgi:LuxR family maltose regulon positive regulatory protein
MAAPAVTNLGEDLRALALINLGIAELWAARFEDAGRHLEQGIRFARRVGRPYLEFIGLAYPALSGIDGSFGRAAERCQQAIELARRHGWSDEPAAGIAYVTIGVGSWATATTPILLLTSLRCSPGPRTSPPC